ncbi:hypothetical protein BBJ28_00008143 [Nothophytophthora sp. Chile5]|nr:hypothetical protein BBJ28_00008143 [Nothophytophthora sp. Chile5]
MPRAASRASSRKVEDQRFVFVDLDALLASVRSHVVAHEAIFHTELAQFSTDVALHPEKLTVLLNDQKPARVQCWRATYCANPNLAEAKALEAIRSDSGQKVAWKLTQKGTPEHPTLEKMIKKNVGAGSGSQRTLVLATGALNKSMKSCVDAYLKANWRVQLVCLTSCWSKSGWEFTEEEGFQVKSLDKYLKRLLTGCHAAAASTTRPEYERKGSSPLLRSDSSFSNSSSTALNSDRPPLPSDYYQVAAEDRRAGMLEQELGDIQRRKMRLAELPTGKYAAANRQRFVFMNLDNIAGAVCNSQWLYQRIEGASSGYDVRLNFRALTERVCGNKPELVKKRLAAYRKMPRELALPLQEFEWEINALSQTSSGNKGLYYALLDLLETAGSAKHKNTLVLVMGDGALGGSGADQKEATRELLGRFLENNWAVEVHSWLHALNDWFVDLQEQYQYRVAVKPLDDAIHDLVYLKQDEEEVWVEPVWHDPSAYHREAANAPPVNAPATGSPPPPAAWGTSSLSTLSLFPTTPFLTPEQKAEQKTRLENERKELLERLRRNQEALDALERETWTMQIKQQEELALLAQQESDKQLAIRMAQEEEMQSRLLREYEESQEELPWSYA